MYENVKHQGMTLSEWQKELNYAFTLGELYRMYLDGVDFNKLS